jgi:hypothetical protein
LDDNKEFREMLEKLIDGGVQVNPGVAPPDRPGPDISNITMTARGF